MPARTLLVATAAFAAGVDVTAGATRSPVIILPGDGASALEAKLDKETKSHFYCAKTSDWYRLWADATQLAPGVVDCWAENIQLAYDVDADAVADAPGVTVRVVEGLAGLDLAGGVGASASNVYADLIDGLVDVGYERDVTVIGFPYDFRRAPVPGDATAMMARLVATIENATAAHGAPVTLVSHSLGCLNALYLLNTQPAAWRDAHIHAWVPVSPAYGGAVVDLVQFTSGDNEGIPWLSGPTLRDEQRSYESNVWLLPSAALYGADEALVTTPSRNYSAHDYEASDMCCFCTCLPSERWHVHSGQAVTKCVISSFPLEALFAAVGFDDGPALLARVARLGSDAFAEPGVAVFPTYGTGVDTAIRLDYTKDDDWDTAPTIATTLDGDGTVPLRSLAAGDAWARASPAVFDGASHSGILSLDAVIERVITIATIED